MSTPNPDSAPSLLVWLVWSLLQWRRSNLVITALERHDREVAPGGGR